MRGQRLFAAEAAQPVQRLAQAVDDAARTAIIRPPLSAAGSTRDTVLKPTGF